MTIALENASDGESEEDPSLWNLPILQRATREFPDLGICLDTTHIQKFARFPMRAYVDALKDRLCHLHVSDAFAADEPFARMHTSPGKGIIPTGDWLHPARDPRGDRFSGRDGPGDNSSQPAARGPGGRGVLPEPGSGGQGGVKRLMMATLVPGFIPPELP